MPVTSYSNHATPPARRGQGAVLNNRTRRFLFTVLFLLALAAVIGLILVKGPLAPVEVQTAPVRRGDLQPARFGVGTVEARRSYDIGPNRSGRLLALQVDHGDRVRKGQVLGRMDPVDLPQRLRSADKAVQKMEHMVEASRARMAEVKTRLAQAEDDARRYRELGRKKQVSQELVEAKLTEARSLADQYRAAAADLDAAEHDLERSRADRDAIQAQIDDLRLLSPADGLVVARRVEPGSVVVAGSPVLQIIDPATLWVRTRIDQKGEAALARGLDAEIVLRSAPERPLKGRVERIELVADSLTEERWVDVAFERIPDGLAIGSLANVTIHLPLQRDLLWIPSVALHRRDGREGVWMLDAGRARFHPVETGVRTLDGKVQVRAGLKEGDLVIGYTAHALEEGVKLKARSGD